MPPKLPHLLFLAVGLVGGVAFAGCSTSLRPRPLTAAQSSLVDRAGSLGVVAVVDDPCARPGRLAPLLERTGLFRAVVPSGSGGPAPDYVATIRGHCGLGNDPSLAMLLPFVTLGIVPEFHWRGLGVSFTLRDLATGQEAVVPCEIGSLTGTGWIPGLMNVLPGWSSGDVEKTRSFGRRLAYGIVSRLQPPPPPQRSE